MDKDSKGGKTENWMERSPPIYLFPLISNVYFFHCISPRHQNEEPVFSSDCRVFFTTVPLKQGDHGTFNHITMISNRVKVRQAFAEMCRLSLIRTPALVWYLLHSQSQLFDCSVSRTTRGPRSKFWGNGSSHDNSVLFYSSSSKSEGRGAGVRHLTSGSWEVSQILAYDEGARSV